MPSHADIRSPGLAAKVAHLSLRESYPERPAAVEFLETHMSCVFLTDRHVYKLKKPVRFPFLDFGTVEARRIDCHEEVRLNRRLAPEVYLGVVALTADPAGRLALEGPGEPVDWLVKMVRLPRERMLDHMIAAGTVAASDVRRFTRVLARFYRGAPPVPMDEETYVQRLARDLEANRSALADPDYALPASRVAATADTLAGFLDRERALFEMRVAGGRIIEAHGDLRPEHVCLADGPVFIDCLEFNRDFRLLDPADDLGYLAMECAFAGAGWIGDVVFATYREETGDDPPRRLVAFYGACRAMLRAKLAVWHLRDHDPREHAKWVGRATRHLELAAQQAERLEPPG